MRINLQTFYSILFNSPSALFVYSHIYVIHVLLLINNQYGGEKTFLYKEQNRLTCSKNLRFTVIRTWFQTLIHKKDKNDRKLCGWVMTLGRAKKN